MKILNNKSLRKFNSFGVDSLAKYFTECFSVDDLREFIESPFYRKKDSIILGGGSNILFTRDIEKIVIKMSIPGIDIVEKGKDYVLIKVGAGVEWDELVSICVANGWWGIENLSLIPGSAGAAPIQNIGAYGCEIADSIHSVEFVDLQNGNIHNIGKEDCEFGYRTSIFKHKLSGRVIITSINLMLSLYPQPNIDYSDLQIEIGNGERDNLSLSKIRNTIIRIRNNKLPKPSELGNAGSFFKNPILDTKEFNILHAAFKDIKYFPAQDGSVKLSAAWLIEQCGFKGKISGNTGTYQKHALILVNYGNATGSEIYNFSIRIQEAVKNKFNIKLETEVNIV